MLMTVHLATNDDIPKLIPAFRDLRPHRSEAEIASMLPTLFHEGYQVAFVGDEQLAYSVIGFRIMTFLFSGKTLYIDDLSTASDYRKHGYAALLFEWTKEYARQNHCEHFSLDSGFQRRDAYRFYLNQGLFVESLHFGRRVEEL
jgi:GNAT superfamily N-acetyltransferase